MSSVDITTVAEPLLAGLVTMSDLVLNDDKALLSDWKCYHWNGVWGHGAESSESSPQQL